MKRNIWRAILGIAMIVVAVGGQFVEAKDGGSPKQAAVQVAGAPVAFFNAIDEGQIDVKFLAMNDHEARVLIKNKTGKPVSLQMPEAFAGVPVVAQFGGGGGGRGGGGFGGGGGGNRGGGGGGGQQSVGGGGLGGGGGGGLGGGAGGGGGGGFFSVPPDQTAKIDVAVVCLNHGLRDPNSAAAYKIVPADSHIDRPAVIELLKAFGRGGLQHGAAQAAAWHLNNDLSWEQLAAKLQGTRRSTRRPPYFSADEIRAGMAYATEANRLAEAKADEYVRAKKEREAKAAKAESSDKRSTTDTDSSEPANDKDADKNKDKKSATESSEQKS